MISQENGTTAGATNGYYAVDMFVLSCGNGGTNTAQQVASVTPAGSPNRLRVTATVADATVAAADYLNIFVGVEGLRATDLRSGSAAAKTITIQFGVKAPAGTYAVSVQNGSQSRSYPATYVIAGGEANTDVVKSVTLTLDTTGTWASDNNAAFYLGWTLMAGSNVLGTANAWQAGNFSSAAGQFNFMGTNGNVFELFDVSLTEGSVAPPFVVPDYASELAACQRYYRQVTPEGAGIAASATLVNFWIKHIGMRAAPTLGQNTTLTVTDIITSNYSQSAPSSAITVNDADSGLYGFGNFAGMTTGRATIHRNNVSRIVLNARL